jgi:glycosyltransferase involved in cell wall biosynthesis
MHERALGLLGHQRQRVLFVETQIFADKLESPDLNSLITKSCSGIMRLYCICYLSYCVCYPLAACEGVWVNHRTSGRSPALRKDEGRNVDSLSLMPYVSVVLPVRNCERYIEDAVESIVEQTFCNLELIVVDDGSSDRTLEIVAECAVRDPRIRVLARPQLGLVGALEAGRAAARGFYTARMDADDVADPERLRRQVEYLDQHCEVVAVGGQVELIDVEGRSIGCRVFPVTPADCRAYLERGAPFCHPSVMMRSDALALAGGYRASFEPAEDMDLWLRLAEIGELANLDVNVLRYRLHAASTTRTYAASQAAATALALVTARFRPHLSAGASMDGVSQDTWVNIEARLPATISCYAREAYLRALSLNGGIVNREDLALLYASLPTFVLETADKRVLAFGVTRAIYQLCRARNWQDARRLALTAIRLFPISVFAELSVHYATRLIRRVERNFSNDPDASTRSKPEPKGHVEVNAHAGAVFLGHGTRTASARALDAVTVK